MEHQQIDIEAAVRIVERDNAPAYPKANARAWVQENITKICSRNVADVAFALSPQPAYATSNVIYLAQALVDLVQPSNEMPPQLKNALNVALTQTGCGDFETAVLYLTNYFNIAKARTKAISIADLDKWFDAPPAAPQHPDAPASKLWAFVFERVYGANAPAPAPNDTTEEALSREVTRWKAQSALWRELAIPLKKDSDHAAQEELVTRLALLEKLRAGYEIDAEIDAVDEALAMLRFASTQIEFTNAQEFSDKLDLITDQSTAFVQVAAVLMLDAGSNGEVVYDEVARIHADVCRVQNLFNTAPRADVFPAVENLKRFADDLMRIASTLNVAPNLEAVEAEIERLKGMSEAWGKLATDLACDVDPEAIIRHIRKLEDRAGEYLKVHERLNRSRNATGIQDVVLIGMHEKDMLKLAEIREILGRPESPEILTERAKIAATVIGRLGGWGHALNTLTELDKDRDRVVNLVAIGEMIQQERDEWRKIAHTLANRNAG